MNIQGVEEKKGTNYVSYTFYDNSCFDETGYRVVRANLDAGYLRCNISRFNGNIRIIYDVSNLYTLFSAAQLLSPNAFANLIVNIIDVMIEIKKNTFIHIESVDFYPDNVYVDLASLKPYFVYVPVSVQSTIDGIQIMENYMKQNIQYVIQSSDNLKGDLSDNIMHVLSDYSNSLSAIKNKIVSMLGLETEIKKIERQIKSNKMENVEQNNETKNSVVESFSGKLKNRKIGKKKSKDVMPKIENVSADTTVLKEKFSPQIALVGIGTPEKIEFVINKKDYLIGHKKELVDGCVEFNMTISRKHCRISNIKGKNYISDLNSVNGTWVNGKKLSAEKEVEITPGDKIKLSNSEFMVTAVSKGRRKQK